jgi:hypothetical protein
MMKALLPLLVFMLGCGSAGETVQDDPPPSPTVPGPEGARAFAELEAYYGDKAKAPPLGAAIKDLNSDDAERRRSAGRYLLALLAQLLADETNGRGEWTQTGWWGGGSESPTRAFRGETARALAGAAKGEEALDAVLWLLTEEKIAEHQVAGIDALKSIHGAKSSELLVRILREPHPNGAVLAAAVEDVGRRALRQCAIDVAGLASHHRATVRDVVQKVAPALGIDALPAPATVFLPSIDRMLRSFADMILTTIPEDATWALFVIARPERDAEEFSGWKLSERDGIVRMLDRSGHEHEAPLAQVTMTARLLADDARELLQLRQAAATGDREAARRISRQFDPEFISAPEALIAAWSYRRGDRKTAAELLFPRLEAAKDDRWVLWAVRDLLGHLYHRPMLDHFSGERDYAKAIRLAAHLSRDLFDGYEYQKRAKDLQRQLARRSEDFKTLTLPTAEDWAERRAKLSHDDQVRFLVARLRILNCFQWSQPGDVKYTEPQFPKPIAEYRELRNIRRTPTVINPYVELRKLKLSIAELPVLVPFLADEDFMPTYSFWRGFHPSRTLHQVNWVIAKVVDEVALRDLADLDKYSRLNRAGKKAHLENILQWCRAHSATPRSDLLLQVIRTAPQWENLMRQAAEAFEANVRGALDALSRRMNEFPDHRENFAELCQTTHVSGALPLARSWLTESSKEVRLSAGLILLRGDEADRRAGLAALDKILRNEGFDLLPYALDDLLAAKTPETNALALLALKKQEGREWSWSDHDILRRLFLAGLTECRDHVLAKLASNEVIDHDYTAGDGMAAMVAEWSDAFTFDPSASAEDRKKLRVQVARWVQEQSLRIERGEKPYMKTESEPIRRGRWMFDAP